MDYSIIEEKMGKTVSVFEQDLSEINKKKQQTIQSLVQ